MKLDIPVMLAALLLAALVQELLPAIPCGAPELKLQLLPAVALYYLYRRQWPVALSAALWAGIATDALGGLPAGATSFPLLLIGAVIVAVRDVTERRSPWMAAVPGMVVSLLLGFVQVVCFRHAAETVVKPPFFATLFFFVKTLPLAAVAAVVLDAVLAHVELLAGNVEPNPGEALQ